MYKIIILLLLTIFSLVDAGPSQAESIANRAETAVSSNLPKVPRPNYKRYRGNSRSKHRRLGFFRRRAARRKALRKRKTAVAPRKGVISVDEPKGTMPKQ